MTALLDILLLVTYANGVATVTLRVDSPEPASFAAVQAIIRVPAEWQFIGYASPASWTNTTLVADPTRVTLFAFGEANAPLDAITLTFRADSPGCVWFDSIYPYETECVPSGVFGAAPDYPDITGQRIGSCEAVCAGDRNGDGVVDLVDLSDLLGAYGCIGGLPDLTRLLSRYGESCE